MIARRALLKAAAAGATAQALGLASTKAAAASPELCDVIVVGSGIAGLCAAAAAKEAGAERVLILEKGPLIGGHSLYSSGSIAAVVASATNDAEFNDSAELFINDAMSIGGGKGNPEILRKIALGSENAIKWLSSMGATFGAPFVAHSGLHPRSFAMPGNSAGRSYVLMLAQHAFGLGASARLNAKVCRVRHLESTAAPCWEVTYSETTHPEKILKIFSRSVVFACGGFTADVARRSAINAKLTADVMTSANPYGTVWDGADGDGLYLASSAGGEIIEGMGLQMLPFWGGRLLDYAGGDVYLNERGERFVNETLPWNAVSEEILKLPQKRCWVVTDRQSYKGATLGLKLINGIVRKAYSIEELARGMHTDESRLAATLKKYNEAARAGFDPLTGKRIFTQTIESPPFYYGLEHIFVHTTLDGIATDDCARVLDGKRAPIDGLFAAGETAGGIFGTDRLGGAAITNCLVMGREAGRMAARCRSAN